jgi:hypothetical protein
MPLRRMAKKEGKKRRVDIFYAAHLTDKSFALSAKDCESCEGTEVYWDYV